jgi:nucleotide-binding universal stress UspA family protein
MQPQPTIRSIFHPSDFSDASEVAFAHALKLTLASRALLQMMHVETGVDNEGDDFPRVRETLERWKLLPAGSSHRDVGKLGIEVHKVIASSNDPVKACLNFLEINDADLIVLSVQQRDGIMRWLGNMLGNMVGEKIAQGSGQMTLFIPNGLDGFVSVNDGSVRLKNILIPIVNKPRPEAAVETTLRLIHSLNLPSGTVTLLHVGTSESTPVVDLPESTGWSWNQLTQPGDKSESIVQVAQDLDADLIVMTTDGPDRFLDGLRGTTSERVLRKAHCPVAFIPVERIDESADEDEA